MLSATKRMWAQRWRDATGWATYSLSTRCQITLNPLTWVVFLSLIVIDALFVPWWLWIKFWQTFFDRIFDASASKGFVTTLTIVLALPVAIIYVAVNADQENISETSTPIAEVALELLTPIDRVKWLIAHQETGALNKVASHEYLMPRIKAFDDLGSTCLRSRIKPYLAEDSEYLRISILNKIVYQCYHSYGTIKDPYGRERQKEMLRKALNGPN